MYEPPMDVDNWMRHIRFNNLFSRCVRLNNFTSIGQSAAFVVATSFAGVGRILFSEHLLFCFDLLTP